MMTSLPEEEDQVHVINQIVPSQVEEDAYLQSLEQVAAKVVSNRKKKGATKSPKKSKIYFLLVEKKNVFFLKSLKEDQKRKEKEKEKKEKNVHIKKKILENHHKLVIWIVGLYG